MKKWFLVVGLVLLISALPGIATAQTAIVDYYANNTGPGSAVDQTLRLINVGQLGTPLSSPMGDICANIYVFDTNEAMIACCSCRMPPNALASASVGHELTNHPLTSVIPRAGVITILPIIAGTVPCSPIAPFASPDASLVKAFSTHVEVSGPATFITETALLPAPLSRDGAAFLSNACLFLRYLAGSGSRGTCGCTTPGR
jgi:hypothetical protein